MSALSHPQLPLALPLREHSTLEGFAGVDNAALVGALRSVAEGQGQVYVYGPNRSGRSHLLEATVRHALDKGRAACYLSAAELLTAPVGVLEGLEQMSLVAIDDVDHLAGQPEWEEGLFHLYNRVRDSAGSMVFTAGNLPNGAGFQLPDLSSRLSAGPVFQVAALTDAELVALLVRRSAARGLDVSEDVAAFVVHRCERSAGVVVDYLAQLDHGALVHQRRLTVPFIKAVLGW